MVDRRLLVEVVLALAAVALAVTLVTRFVAVPWVVSGVSMAPTLEPGDRVIVDLWSYRSRPPRPGEIALFFGPGGVAMVKRVAEHPPAGGPAVGNDEIYVLGDNPALSHDSRAFGAVPRERFRGRLLWRYWPPSRVGRVR